MASSLILLLNFPQIVVSAATASYAIWFADHEQRNVGARCQSGGRDNPGDRRNAGAQWLALVDAPKASNGDQVLEKKIAVASLLGVILLFGLGSRFICAGAG
ncbi:hypothetical protein [Variovorax boronicumulans]|uniref:hypothetical protein n=1 Tax=Variovorax boronicumulans TaxID=436515 RepID=UPI001C5883A9